MLEGLLVDLVPYNKVFRDLEHTWRNSEASFWSSGGERYIVTHAMLNRQFEEWGEHKQNNPSRGVIWGAQTKTGEPIGMFGINWIVPTSRLGMLGAKIGDPAYWGGGYGTDALLLLVDYAFNWLDLRKVWLLTTSMNARVLRQMEKVGFRPEGRSRQAAYADGRWYDWIAYGLLRDEWPGRAALLEQLNLHQHEGTEQA
jgi:RimJ/RimL family protein N-acetyltransferase